MSVRLFTDGGSRSGSGSAACIIDRNGKRERYCAFLGAATNNEAEIFALLLGLKILRDTGGASRIEWFADSEYTLKSATEYIHNWKRNGWKTAAKDPVKNQGLWRAYLDLSTGVTLKPNHVRGHSGHPENEECDAACQWMIATNGENTEGQGGPDDSWILSDASAELNEMRNAAGATAEPDRRAVQPSFFSETDDSSKGTSSRAGLKTALSKALSVAEQIGEVEIAATLKLLLQHQNQR